MVHLDNVKRKKAFQNIKNRKPFLFFIYHIISIAITVIILWLFFLLSLLLFLIVASYHFGKEDTSISYNKKIIFR